MPKASASAMTNASIYLFVALGGALGATLRFFIMQISVQWLGKDFPFGTLLVNIVGSFFLGLMYALIEQGYIADFPWRAMISVGLLGALTTFSTFSVDSLLLLQQGQYVKSVVNIALNVVLCMAVAWLGMQVIKGN